MAIAEIIHNHVDDRIYAVQAGNGDEQAIHMLYVDTAKWLNSIGSTQWRGLLVGEDVHKLPGAIARGEVFAFRTVDHHQLAGSVILQQHPSEWDRKLWGFEETSKAKAVYLHRLAVNRNQSGTGLGSKIMKWVEEGVLYKDKDRINLDCIASNEKLNRFYRSCGYTYMGETDGFSKYQKMLR